MAYTPGRYTGDGSTRIYTIPFTYLSKAHVKVYLNGISTAAFTWLSTSQIQLNAAPSSGTKILVQRETPTENRMVTFRGVSAIDPAALDTNTDYLLNAIQEGIFGVTDSQQRLAALEAGLPANLLDNFGVTAKLGDLIAKGPWMDVRAFMDGQAGRPTVAQWAAAMTTTDVTACIQAAIDTGRPVYFPVGTFLYTKLTLRDCTQLLGMGMRLTVLKAATSAEPYSVVIDSNYVRSVRIENMQFTGNVLNAGQGCWYFKGAYPPLPTYQQGGIWYSVFKNVRIDSYTGNSIWLRGGTDGYLLPDQFLTFENVVVYREPISTSRSLLMTGECCQTVFNNCEFSAIHGGVSAGINIELSREFQNGSLVGGSTIGGAAVSDICPINVTFGPGTTTQYSVCGFDIDRCQNITMRGMWFEQLQKAVTVHTSARVILLSGCHFANAGADGAGNGYLLSISGGCSATFENNDVMGAYDTGLIGTNSFGIVERGNTWSTSPTVVRTKDIAQQLTIAADGSLNVNHLRFILVNGAAGTGAELANLISNIGVGETFAIRAVTSPVVVNNTGNIRPLFGRSKVTIQPSEIAIFTRQDYSVGTVNEFQMVSLNRSLSGPTLARPVLAAGEAGVVYWNTDTGLPEYSYGDGTWAVGTKASTVRLRNTTIGAAMASASTIAPTELCFHVTGTEAIDTITPESVNFRGSITIIPDGAFTTTTAGNIGKATTAVVGRALTLTYDGTKWYPSY